MKNQTAPGRFGAVVLVVLALTSSACGSTTTFASSWRSPKAEPLAMRGEKMAAVVMAKNDATRRNAEDVLAREITHYGAKGVPMYTLMSEPAAGNEAAARAAVERAGIKGVVVMRPMGTRTKTETHKSYYSDPMYGSYWGGYYGYGWGSPWIYPGSSRGALVAGPPVVYGGAPQPYEETYTTTTQVIEVEVMVYSLKQNMLVWGGVSQTTEADKVDEFVTQLAAATVKELGGQGLLSSN